MRRERLLSASEQAVGRVAALTTQFEITAKSEDCPTSCWQYSSLDESRASNCINEPWIDSSFFFIRLIITRCHEEKVDIMNFTALSLVHFARARENKATDAEPSALDSLEMISETSQNSEGHSAANSSKDEEP